MDTQPTGTVGRGTIAGILAGGVFLVAELADALAAGTPELPVRFLAATVLGEPALDEAPMAPLWANAALVHLIVSATWGAIWAVVAEGWRQARRPGLGTEAIGGLAFGTFVWFFDLQVLARLLYPWFLDLPQPGQWALHAVFFGLPLALLTGIWERVAFQRPPQPA